MASGLKIAYIPKIELVLVADTTKTVSLETLPKFKLVVIVAAAPPTIAMGAQVVNMNPLGVTMFRAGNVRAN